VYNKSLIYFTLIVNWEDCFLQFVMGSFYSKWDIDNSIKDVTNQVKEQRKKDEETTTKGFKLVILGALESGKSTIAKQMRILYQDGFSDTERISYKEVVFANTVQSMAQILKAMKSLNISYDNPEREEDERIVRSASPGMWYIDISKDIGAALKRLWEDDGVKKCYARSREYYLYDTAAYYFDALDRLCTPDYLPTEQDVLHTRVKTTGILETPLECKGLQITLVDVGGARSERKKWIHCFENVTAIIFCASLSAYDQLLAEDEDTNRMKESLNLFEALCNNPFFSKTPVILFLNKKDLFERKITRSDLTICFAEYEGANEYESALEYVRKQFKSRNKPGDQKQIYTHLTCATDTDNMRFVFDAVLEVLMRKIHSPVFGSGE